MTNHLALAIVVKILPAYLLKSDCLGSFMYIMPMRKSYITILLLSFVIISSYVADNKPAVSFPDDPDKVIHFYPNPATSFINFIFDKTVDKTYTLQIYSFIGKKMNETHITDSKMTITLDENYFRGLYVYQLRDQSGRIIESGKFQVAK